MDVVARQGTVRCALCHEAVAAAATTSCAGCATVLHVECARDVARCPTLGCASPTFGTPPAPASDGPPVKRWVVFGLVGPAVAFAVDLGLHVNPIAWGGFRLLGVEPGERLDLTGWSFAVLLLAALSMVGMLLALRGQRGAVTRLLLGAGVALATAHAVAFTPLLPMSLIGILWLGFGLLGLTPFAAMWAYLSALGRALRAAKGDEGAGRRPLLGQGLAVLAGLGLLASNLTLRAPAFIAAPAARHLEDVDVAALRSAVASLPPRPDAYEAHDPATLPEPLRSVAGGAVVRGGPSRVVVEYDGARDRPDGFPHGYRLHIVVDGQDPTTAQEPCRRWVEVQPGCWSEYVLKTIPRRTVKRFGEE